MTKLLSLLTVLLLTVTKGRTQPTGSPEEECCEEKIVGGIKYINIGTDNSGIAMEMDCLSNCIFMKEGAPESKYCFAKGSLEVECVGLSTSEITPRPSPSGGGETTPVSGGETTAPEGGPCIQVLCCGSDGVTYPTPCDAPDGVTCVDNNECPAPMDITWTFNLPQTVRCAVIGTTVTFSWSGTFHNVVSLGSSEVDYTACSGITNTVGEAGPFTWVANTLGIHYFVCGVGSHCQGGMKAAINVTNTCP